VASTIKAVGFPFRKKILYNVINIIVNKDVHLLAEMYRSISEQQLSPKTDTNKPTLPGFAVHPDYYKNKKPTLPGLGQINVTITPNGGVDLNETILFDFDKSVLKPQGVQIIQNIAKKILSANNPNTRVIVTGYTDLYGGVGYNQQLSMSRAEAVSQALQQAGVSNVSAKPGGMKNAKVPLKFNLVDGKAPEQGIQQQQPNRRVEIDFNPPLPREIINSISTLR